MNKFNIINKNLSNLSNTSLSSVKGIVIFSNPDYYEKAAQYDGFDKVSFLNKDTKDFGYHYGIDQYDIVSYIPKQYQAICLPDAPTYISNGIFGGKPEESCISIHLFICPSHDYEETEKYFVSFVVKLMKDNNLKAEDIWRGFDLSSNNKGPFHMLDLDIWKAYLDIFKKFEDVSLDDYDSVSWDSPYKSLAEEKGVSIDEYVKSIYNDNLSNLDNYVGNFKPYDKGIQAALDAQNISIQEEIKNADQKTGNHLKYQITHNPPGNGCNCMKRFDKLDAEEKAKDIKVEPIYPDLITPPGAEINVANGNSQAKTQSSSDTPLTVEEFEKRQKVFDINNFDNISKHTKGRPVNCDDPFPVDEQIKKLEQHYPKCKVDKVTYDFTEDNHLGSQLGAAMAKNYNMCYDMITEVSRRVETRLVKLENNLATVMRNLFRVGSRVNINCVYYGGQSIYGKYNCIRCLYDDRVNDGAVVSLDQCLCCTRYEPIEGQVYAILDEAGNNLSQVIDDMQMSYLSIDEMKELSKVESFHTERSYSNLTQDATETPEAFSQEQWADTDEEKEAKNKNHEQDDSENIDNSSDDGFGERDSSTTDLDSNNDSSYSNKNGFVMSWTPTLLETHQPNINKYEPEDSKLYKPIVDSNNQDIDREQYIDTRQDAKEYEKLEFNVKDYVISGFGQGGGIGSGLNGTGAECRKKICEYAQKALDLANQGKAKYSQGLRYCHDGKEVDGIAYWDCSSLAAAAYAYAGISGIGSTTFDEYPHDLTSAGGILIPRNQIDKALPGDMMWFSHSYGPDLTEEQLQSVDVSTIHHVAIYMGDNKWIEAQGTRAGIVGNTMDNTRDCFAFGRPKELVDADKSAAASGVGYWSKDAQGISDELWNAASVVDGQVQSFINNMNTYGYKDALISTAQSCGYDPYFIASIITVESTGDPNCGGSYPGLMQCTGGSHDPATNIQQGCSQLQQKANVLKTAGWTEQNLGVLTNAYNCGEGIPLKCHSELGVDLATISIGEMADKVKQIVQEHYPSYGVEEKRTYATKICRAYIQLYQSGCLN